MKKSDKKIENSLIKTLTQVCETAKVQYEGFEWLTHCVNYNVFPSSLSVVCIFDTNANMLKSDNDAIKALIQQQLASINIKLKDINKHVRFDSEENGQIEHNGK